ncbi:MAG: hypothetical protein QOF61_2977 [Acidobacteriota bacterium]|nr:hypothetical protein [Acidobacteriota bacterium]
MGESHALIKLDAARATTGAAARRKRGGNYNRISGWGYFKGKRRKLKRIKCQLAILQPTPNIIEPDNRPLNLIGEAALPRRFVKDYRQRGGDIQALNRRAHGDSHTLINDTDLNL